MSAEKGRLTYLIASGMMMMGRVKHQIAYSGGAAIGNVDNGRIILETPVLIQRVAAQMAGGQPTMGFALIQMPINRLTFYVWDAREDIEDETDNPLGQQYRAGEAGISLV